MARDSLGVPAVVFFVMSGIAPLTVAAGVIPTAYAVTGVLAIPAAFLVVFVVLAVWSSGYVAMARHVRNSGAFYAMIARGLGRPAGVGAALVALVAYELLAVGLFGAFGPGAAQEATDKLHVHSPWWSYALGAWAVVAVLGRSGVKIAGRVLAVLLSVEVLITIGLTVVGLAHPANHHVSLATLNPGKLAVSGIGAALAVAVLGFVGFEGAAVLSEEAKNPRRTIATATYLSLGLIAVVYAGASWALAVHYGNDQVVSVAQQQGPGALFGLASGWLSDAGQVFYLTSLFAAMLAFHSFVVRYVYALGREGVLPRVLERTARSGAPHVASMLQSLVGLAFIVVWALTQWNPMTTLFFWLGTSGGFGILLLLAVTAVAVVAFFARHPLLEPVWPRLIAPGIATVLLVVGAVLVVHNYATLLGVTPGHSATNLPWLFALAGLLGVLWGVVLRVTRPQVYDAIGLGAEATIRQDKPLATPARHWSKVRL